MHLDHSVTRGESIRFEITDLQVETHGSCLFDYVEVGSNQFLHLVTRSPDRWFEDAILKRIHTDPKFHCTLYVQQNSCMQVQVCTLHCLTHTKDTCYINVQSKMSCYVFANVSQLDESYILGYSGTTVQYGLWLPQLKLWTQRKHQLKVWRWAHM